MGVKNGKEKKKHLPDSCTCNFVLPETPPSKPEANRQKKVRKEDTNHVCFSCIGEYRSQVSKPTHHVIWVRDNSKLVRWTQTQTSFTSFPSSYLLSPYNLKVKRRINIWTSKKINPKAKKRKNYNPFWSKNETCMCKKRSKTQMQDRRNAAGEGGYERKNNKSRKKQKEFINGSMRRDHLPTKKNPPKKRRIKGKP